MKTLFVTGTDTGVGKTLISKALIDYFVSQGELVAPMKPVASGAFIQHDKLVNDDALILIDAANARFDYATVNPYVFEEPIAPHIAAARNEVEIDIQQLNRTHQKLVQGADRIIVEGAGGWQVPLTTEVSMADWVSKNRWPVVLVIGLRLGCINHARLTYLDLLAKQSHLAGWVINKIDPDVLVTEEVIEDLKGYIKAPLLGVVPWLASEAKQAQAPDVAQYLDFSLLGL